MTQVLELEITIIQADGLAAKDTNFLGMRTSSDPYIEVRLLPRGPSTPTEEIIFLGKTPVIRKTLKPKWDNVSFSTSVPLLQCKEDACFELKVMDWDRHTEDDLMGVVQVYVHPEHCVQNQTKWYGIPASSAGGDEAKGRVQCMLTTKRGVQTS